MFSSLFHRILGPCLFLIRAVFQVSDKSFGIIVIFEGSCAVAFEVWPQHCERVAFVVYFNLLLALGKLVTMPEHRLLLLKAPPACRLGSHGSGTACVWGVTIAINQM